MIIDIAIIFAIFTEMRIYLYHAMKAMKPEVSPESTGSYRATVQGSVKTGVLAGIAASWAIFGMILAVGGQLGLPPQTFYQMVGVSLGVNAEWPATYLGFLLHMMTGGIIGIVYMIISDRVEKLRINSTPKAFATGVATGIAVWALLFVPMHFFLMQPTLQNQLLTSPAGSPLHLIAERLIQMSDSVLFGALAIHFVFGGVLGFISRIARSA